MFNYILFKKKKKINETIKIRKKFKIFSELCF